MRPIPIKLPSPSPHGSQPIAEVVWGRKRSVIRSEEHIQEKRLKGETNKSDAINNELINMKKVIDFCDEVLRMFDELVIPAARLLDTVENQVNVSKPLLSTDALHQDFKPPRIVNSSPSIDKPFWITKQGQESRNTKLSATVCAESDRIDWSSLGHFTKMQLKQADEEEDTDEEMVEYGVKVANRNVRIACKAIKTRDWSLGTRIQSYNLSVKRLTEVNRRRARLPVCSK